MGVSNPVVNCFKCQDQLKKSIMIALDVITEGSVQ